MSYNALPPAALSPVYTAPSQVGPAAPNAFPSSGASSMSADELMSWLRSRMDKMGGEVAQGTQGVDERQKAVDDLVQAKSLKSPQDNDKIVALYKDALTHMPKGSQQAAQVEGWMKAYDNAGAAKAKQDSAKAILDGPGSDAEKTGQLMALGLPLMEAVGLMASWKLNKANAPATLEATLKTSFPPGPAPTVDRTAENENIDQIKSDYAEQNQQETVLLQQTMNRAQEALSELSGIFKGMHDMVMDVIHKIA